MGSRLTLAAGLIVASTGMAQADAFLCPGFGDVDVRIMFLEGTNAAVAEFLTGADSASGGVDPVTMRSQHVGDGFHYVGGDLDLRGNGGLADLTSGGMTVHCELEAAGAGEATVDAAGGAVEDAEGEATGDASGAADIPAISLGGNLRSGPGTEFEDVGGLEQGTPITLLVDTGVVLDGYTWWEIEQANGQIAFQWGGVICVPGGGVNGVFESCN